MGWIIGGAAVLLLAIVLIIRSEYEKRHLVVTRYEVASASVPGSLDGKKAVFLSDLHRTTFGKDNIELVEKIVSEDPGVVILGGDMTTVKRGRKQDLSSLRTLLAGLGGRFPVVAGSGNHEDRFLTDPRFSDFYAEYEALFSEWNVVRCEDGSAIVPEFDENTAFFGVRLEKRYYTGEKAKNLGKPLFSIDKSRYPYAVALIHSPLYMEEAAEEGADLALAGHFHGGTIYLGKKLGGLMTPQYGFFEKKVRGSFSFGTSTGIVSAGLGTHSVPVRLNDYPEIVSITFRRTEHGTDRI